MIRFEFEEVTGNALTNDQLAQVVNLIVHHGWDLEYDIVEHSDTPLETICLWVHPDNEEENPTRHHIDCDGTIILTEEVTWDWKGLTS